MSGVAAAMTRRGDDDAVLARGPAKVVAPSRWFDAAAANWRLGEDDSPEHQAANRIDAYNDLADELERMGHRYTRTGGGDIDPSTQQQVWHDFAATRQADPKAFTDVPAKTQAEFDTWAAARRGGRARDMRTAAGGGFGSALLPGLAQGITGIFDIGSHPENAAMMGVGGTGKTLIGTLGRQYMAGVLTTAITAPQTVRARAAMGEDYTSNQMLADANMAGLGNAGFVGLHALGAAALGPIIDRYKAAVPAHLRTPDEVDALHTAEQVHETEATSPYTDTHAGLAEHAARLQAAIDAVAGRPAPDAAPSPRVAPVAAPARGGGGGLNPAIVSFFEQSGYSDAQARGIAAGIHAESGGNPLARNPSSGAMGIGQWLGPRKAALIERFGANPSLHEQLQFLDSELRGGDRGGKHVMAAGDEASALDAYVRKFMRPKAGMETNGDLARGMAALGRRGEATPSVDYGVDDAAGAPQLAARSPELDAERPAIMSAGRAIPTDSFVPGDIGVDADLMQFKSGGDGEGVTDRLHGVEQWDPLAAGMATVWEANDGRRLIADGHQRLGLANRMLAADPSQEIRLNAFVLRESEGFSATDARVLTALKNIGEGTGTATDAAKVLRDVGLESDAIGRRLPPRSALIRDGKALARLSPEAFGAVVNDVIPESHGAAIGALAHDPATHGALVDLLHDTAPETRKQAEAVVRQALDVGFATEHQNELFGTRTTMNALFASKAKVLDRTLGELRKMKGAFQIAARNADTLESAGNSISVDASEAAAAGNARALALIDRLALRKGNVVSDLFNDAAQRLAAGERIGDVVKRLVGDVGKLDLTDVARETGSAGDAGERYVGGGDDADAASADGDHLAPSDRDELEAAGQGGFGFDDPQINARFDDPAGDGVALAADSAWHDIAAGQDPNIAVRLRQEAQLRADAPMRGENRTGQAQDGTMGSPLFDAADAPSFDLDDGRGARPVTDIIAEFDGEKSGLDAIKGCLL